MTQVRPHRRWWRRPVDDHPRTRLAHLLDFESSGSFSFKSFLTYPLPAARPESGSATTTAICGACGARFAIVVHSARHTTRLRRLWLSLLIASSLPVIVPLILGVGSGDPFTWWGVAAANGCGVVVLIVPLFALWYQEDGVRGPGRFWVKTHMLRYSPGVPPGAPPARVNTLF